MTLPLGNDSIAEGSSATDFVTDVTDEWKGRGQEGKSGRVGEWEKRLPISNSQLPIPNYFAINKTSIDVKQMTALRSHKL
jgi:hypothetical protein